MKTSGAIANGTKLGTMVDVQRIPDCWTGRHVRVEPRNASGHSCTHTFSVRAVSDLGTDASPATKSWQVSPPGEPTLDCNITQTRSIWGVTRIP